MIISIASGKGGTGKTTVATNLAASISSTSVHFLDCDVEEPNAHLFLNPVIDRTETITVPVPEIDENKCTLCGKCVDICQFKAIAIMADTILSFNELCHSCGGCVRVCPEKAITETVREVGILQSGKIKNISFTNGLLRIGEAMSPPLISKVRSSSPEKGLTIIDAPPGTSCPVIASLKDTDFVILVTEPTPFGLNDLKLAVEAIKIMGIPCGIVLNRSDIGNSSVQEYAAKESILILMEIPFDRRIAESYSKGELIIKAIPELKRRFQRLYTDILTITGKRKMI